MYRKRSANNETRCLDIPITLLPSFLLSAKISLGDIQSRCLSLLESRLHVLGEQKEGREEDERAFLGVSFFFFSSSQQGGEVGESSGSRSILPRAGSIMFL